MQRGLPKTYRPARAIEQGHAELPFEICQGLADDGLRSPKLAPGGGEAACSAAAMKVRS